MKRILKTFLLALIFIFSASIFAGEVDAAVLKFNKTTVNVNTDETFQVEAMIDSGTQPTTSTDAYVLYDSTVLEAQSVSLGSFFPTMTKNITTGKIYIAGLVDDPATFKTGSGTLATITFKALKNGSDTLRFDCDLSKNVTSKIIKNDINATNIIECAGNGAVAVTVGGGAGGGGQAGGGGAGAGAGAGGAQQLPRSGILDNLLKYSIPGLVLLLIGVASRLIL